ncbi:MAG: division/cell wall cluster transcriptional repressor MraZ [Planctomycetota bacterium]
MPARFMGLFEHCLDDKGRVIVPARLRERIDPEVDGEGFYVTRGPELCLFLYTPTEWEIFSRRMEVLPRGSRELRRLQRNLHAKAQNLSLDRQGRILLPENLRVEVGIEREIVFAGCHDRIEIWSKPGWMEEEAVNQTTYGDDFQFLLGGDRRQE